MLGNLDILELTKSKREFDKFKLSKLAFVAHKHKEDKFSLSDLYAHFEQELEELKAITDKTVLPNKAFLEELADISNMIDLMFGMAKPFVLYHLIEEDQKI